MKTHEFYYGTSYYNEFVAENTKNYFFAELISKNVEPIDLCFFPKQKYGSKGPAKNANGVVCALLRFLIEKLLFC